MHQGQAVKIGLPGLAAGGGLVHLTRDAEDAVHALELGEEA